MPAPKGTRPPAAGKGRPKGARNKLTRDIREMIRAALDKAGGIAYLVKQAELNPTAFMSLLGKMIPTQIDATIKRELPEISPSSTKSVRSDHQSYCSTGVQNGGRGIRPHN